MRDKEGDLIIDDGSMDYEFAVDFSDVGNIFTRFLSIIRYIVFGKFTLKDNGKR